MKTQVSIKQIVTEFIYINSQLKELFKDRKEFQPIIKILCDKDYLDIAFRNYSACTLAIVLKASNMF